MDLAQHPLPTPLRVSWSRKRQPGFDLRGGLYRLTGVDLTQVDGLDVQTIQTVLSEVGWDMSAWKTEKHFGSGLGLSPDNRISGGTVLKRGTRKPPLFICNSFHYPRLTFEFLESEVAVAHGPHKESKPTH